MVCVSVCPGVLWACAMCPGCYMMGCVSASRGGRGGYPPRVSQCCYCRLSGCQDRAHVCLSVDTTLCVSRCCSDRGGVSDVRNIAYVHSSVDLTMCLRVRERPPAEGESRPDYGHLSSLWGNWVLGGQPLPCVYHHTQPSCFSYAPTSCPHPGPASKSPVSPSIPNPKGLSFPRGRGI